MTEVHVYYARNPWPIYAKHVLQVAGELPAITCYPGVHLPSSPSNRRKRIEIASKLHTDYTSFAWARNSPEQALDINLKSALSVRDGFHMLCGLLPDAQGPREQGGHGFWK